MENYLFNLLTKLKQLRDTVTSGQELTLDFLSMLFALGRDACDATAGLVRQQGTGFQLTKESPGFAGAEKALDDLAALKAQVESDLAALPAEPAREGGGPPSGPVGSIEGVGGFSGIGTTLMLKLILELIKKAFLKSGREAAPPKK